MWLLIMGGFKFWVVTIILQLKILRLQLLGGYYYATVTITGITVLQYRKQKIPCHIFPDFLNKKVVQKSE